MGEGKLLNCQNIPKYISWHNRDVENLCWKCRQLNVTVSKYLSTIEHIRFVIDLNELCYFYWWICYYEQPVYKHKTFYKYIQNVVDLRIKYNQTCWIITDHVRPGPAATLVLGHPHADHDPVTPVTLDLVDDLERILGDLVAFDDLVPPGDHVMIMLDFENLGVVGDLELQGDLELTLVDL